ncbi:MAG: VIT and VWA domain-containing protein [Deltaproteobacteria bacterium]|nr:VIT and VWA domain-containing protein [Kofleriaceae bacterium]
MLLAVDGDARTELPLVSSAMRVDVRGPIAQVQVTQTFSNPADKPIELVYVFPLHEDGAVGAMTMRIGPRVIRAQIKKRDEARAAYEGAKREGKTAALLEQERPNIFTQSVANVMPGESIDVALTYDVLLDPDGEVYELALPTVVGPRYNPGAPLDGASGTGVQPDTDRVPDASRISPEAAPPGVLTGNAVTLALDVDAGLPIAAIESPTHRIVTKQLTADHYQVGLAAGDMVADRDFVLRWRVTVASPTLAALAHKGAGHGHLALVVQPPPVDAGKAPPRELVFVVDTSGSMSGEPLALAKRGMRYALDHLRPEDTFRIMNFSTSVAGFAEGRAMPATRDNVRAGLSYVNGVAAGGGTEMLGGIVAALSSPPADGRDRYVVFMTDGYIGNEAEIFAAVTKHLDRRTHLFSFGVGSSVNRHLLDGLARSGKGVAQYLLLDEAPEPQIETFYARLDAPLLHDLRVDWGGLDVRDPTPSDLADLFAGQPLVVAARYGRGGRGTIKITGKAAGRTLELAIPVDLPARGGDGDVLARLWARTRMGEQLDRFASADHAARKAIIDDVTGVALEHALLSPWTAFVAIDEIPRAEGMPTDTVPVPVELPAGVTPAAGNVIVTADYTASIPVGGRTFGSVLGSAAGSGGDSYGVSFAGSSDVENDYELLSINASTASVRYDVRHRVVPRLSLSAGLGVGANDGDYASVALGFERGLGGGPLRSLAAGLETRFDARGEQSNLVQLMLTLARLAILRHVDLRLGAGGTLDMSGNLGLGWKAELAFPVAVSPKFLPELTLGAGGSTAGEDFVGAGLGLGLRW